MSSRTERVALVLLPHSRVMQARCHPPTMLEMTADEDLQRTRDHVAQAIADAVSQAEAVSDNATAYQQASWLADELAAGVSATGRLRARIARRGREAGALPGGGGPGWGGPGGGGAGDMRRARDAAGRPGPPPGVAPTAPPPRGARASRRNAGRPPWGFIAGKIEPGESAADAAVR